MGGRSSLIAKTCCFGGPSEPTVQTRLPDLNQPGCEHGGTNRSGLSRGLFRHAASQIRDDGLVKNKAAYGALALNPNGEKDVLWLWFEPQSSCRSLRAARAGGGRRP
jgi:hypothetical protein